MQITIGSTETKEFKFIKSDTSNEQYGAITSVAGTLLDMLDGNTTAANNTQK